MSDVEAVRERLAQMRALCERAPQRAWSSPAPVDLLLRLVTEAESVLSRHRQSRRHDGCAEEGFDWPCAEVEAVIRAWTL